MTIRAKIASGMLGGLFSIALLATAAYYYHERAHGIKDLDAKLLQAATFTRQSLPENYHDRITGAGSVPRAEFEAIVDRNNRLCGAFDLQYLWSVLVLGPDKIVFTSSTSPGHDVKEQDHAHFFETHNDPGAFSGALATMKPTYSTFKNEWGWGRMVLIPGRDSRGRVFMFGASTSMEKLMAWQKRTLLTAAAATALLLLLGLAYSLFLAGLLSGPAAKLTEMADKIAGGDYGLTAHFGGAEEMVSLSSSINRMSRTIREKISTLDKSEKRYSTLFETMGEGFATHEVILDKDGAPSDYRFLEVNPAFEKITGMKRSEVEGKLMSELLPQTDKEWVNKFCSVASTGKGFNFERFANDTEKWYEGAVFRPREGQVAVTFLDITERKETELKLEKAKTDLLKNLRLYRMLARINRAAAATTDINSLYKNLCEASVNEGNFRMAWVGLPDSDTGRLHPLCAEGETGDYLDSIKIPLDDPSSPMAKGPSGRAARSSDITVCMDIETDPRMEPWRKKAMEMGYASSAAVPLVNSAGRLISILNIYSGEKNWFTEEEIELLEAVKADSELAIEAIASEEKRNETEAALKRTAAHLSHIMETIPAVIFQMRRMGDTYTPVWISGDMEGITGYDPAEMMSPEWFPAVTFREEREAVSRDAVNIFEKGGAVTHDFRIRHKDGRIIWLHAQLKGLDKASGDIIGSWTDITALKETLAGGGKRDDG